MVNHKDKILTINESKTFTHIVTTNPDYIKNDT